MKCKMTLPATLVAACSYPCSSQHTNQLLRNLPGKLRHLGEEGPVGRSSERLAEYINMPRWSINPKY